MKSNLLLLPGLLNDNRLWQAQIAGLADVAHSRVADLSGADSVVELASLALAQAPAGHFALAGLSMGGYVALEIMRQAPERVVAVALLDTNARSDAPEAILNREKLMELAKTNFPAVVDNLLPKLLHPKHLREERLVSVISAMADSLGKDVFIRQQKAIIQRPDSRPSLAQIRCPTLVLCGREDVITPVAVHEEMRDAIPESRLVVIETCGHLSALEQPRQVTQALKDWLLQIAR
jgi:pimeloyl-ACP methyl ester carboxylesterase